ncbi:MAG: hypothetical protein KJO69_03370, partial [Gammaproteobacteria bacterium]|nr:hypothetical protein [Gammaproteobacteria bacterium]
MRTCNIEDYSYITNTLIIFILMVLFVMLASVGYFHAQRPPVYDKSQVEITAKEYDILIEYSAKYPSLNREIGDAIANDGIITNQEFSEV